jgi:hypothetical protein
VSIFTLCYHPLKRLFSNRDAMEDQIRVLTDIINELKNEVAGLKDSVGNGTRRASKQTRPQCTATTARGAPCTNRCLPDLVFCGLHSAQHAADGEPRPKRAKKRKRDLPTHSHPPGQSDSTCDLCATLGDILDPTLTDESFELIFNDLLV